ncbi:ImmA/IrrE family metallo-endopeptidase [Lacticaseibacillus rhamnosus]|uniref:ImmA/IrrE family metallo-endopeptidase n=1 Tax=Lacticaseibacillus rhamnosus TaxID=47715 RepID=UPI001013CBD7|nr:ImmA/IrrE family metallo-endopeptidase [Lacticaseibacillus rhamnosus]MCZ2733612.1 ImmA/IrrE family metallo-endopeptidase [Lacticaseibacillus rhamnosus]MCZ2736295.1 ImmA/IrrE family metallo-endopeptidase [Lacticaseibacillus rhamnosus]MCZ2742631.1 ImmA/IrrE family metallo-endopeptidase [Lacticaseibacillus rhamnosus]MCZ2745375.1 ImmA/IrrE family metallo-endopeptidase [Lacticaseibacillus rhamnosus]MCZ2748060.1 ImmA/IrrE family metallo-endopeptidase [Lacticaseibacillus rhamnosus]
MMTDFTEDIFKQIVDYGRSHDIGFELSDNLDPYTPSASNPETRWVAINMNWHDQKQLPFHAAHEIEHIIHQDPKELYFFSNAKTRIEAEANRDAVGLLVPLYFDDIDEEDANLEKFMSAFNIPASMSGIALKAIEKFYM